MLQGFSVLYYTVILCYKVLSDHLEKKNMITHVIRVSHQEIMSLRVPAKEKICSCYLVERKWCYIGFSSHNLDEDEEVWKMNV